MHLHIFAITEDTLRSFEDVAVSDLSKTLKDYMLEPFETVLKSLYDTNLPDSILDPELFKRLEDSSFEGLSFEFDPRLLEEDTFYTEIISLHSRLENLYQKVASIFVDLNLLDSNGMPVLHLSDQINNNIQYFITSLSSHPETLKTILQRVGRVIKSSELITNPSERVFLRGLAYRMSVIDDKKTGKYILNVSPRIFSTGNALTSLRLLYKKVPIVDDEWIEKRAERESYMQNNLTNK